MSEYTKKKGHTRTADKFVLRFPDKEMRKRLAEQADKVGLAMNTVAIDALRAGLGLQEELQIQIEAVKLLRRHLEAEQEALA